MRKRRLHCGSFTLLEMVAVLTLLAVISTLAVVNYRGPVSMARLENVFEQVDVLDARIRLRCRQENVPLQLRIIPAQGGRGVLTAERSDSAELVPIPAVRFGRGMTLVEFQKFDGVGSVDTVVPYSTCGTAPLWCYSIQIANGREFYRLMFGASGQSLTLESEEQWNQWKQFIREQEHEN